MKAYKTTKVTTVAVVTLSALPLGSAVATDSTTRLSVDIAPQSLETALVELSKQGHLQLVIATGSLPAKTSVPLHGSMPLGEALDHLLKDTGLTYRLVGDHTIAIVKANGPARQLSSPPATPGASGVTGPGAPNRDDKIDDGARTSNGNKGDREVNHRSLKWRIATFLGICLSTSAMGPVCAQNAATAEPTQLDEVIVTAQKRSERLLDVPMSVSSTTGEQLTEAGISSTLELQQITPGIMTTNNGLGFSPAIRGVSSAGTTPGDETNVALYLDDVYVGAPIAGFFDLQDIERVEVLKGPQGTLFGRNATGGAIRIVTRAPSFTKRASLSADYGFDFKDLKLGAYLTGPLSTRVAGSIAGSYRTGDGYIEGIGPNVGRRYAKPDNYVYRGKLLFQASEAFKATLAADTWQNQNDIVFIASPPAGVNPYPGSIASSPYRYAGSTQPQALVKGDSFSLDATWEPTDKLSVRSITAYRSVKGKYQADTDRTNQAISALAIDQRQQNLSQEINISSPSDQTYTWLLGAYYYHSSASDPYFTTYLNADAPAGPAFASFTDDVRTKSYAAFGDLTWNASSKLHLTAGARYSKETKDYHYLDIIRAAGIVEKRDEHTWSSPNFRGVVRYDFATDANVYASWSNGFKSGVYNAYSPLGIPVNPEKIDAIEVGLKARVNGITLTAAAYNYDYKDLQVQAHTNVNGVLVTTLTNAAAAKLRGLELTADGKLNPHLSLTSGINWMPTAKYTDYSTASVLVPIPGATGPVVGQTVVPYDATGSRVIKAPDWTANLRLTYTTQIMGGEFAGTVSDAYNPGFYWQAGNLTKEPSYNVASTRLSWTDANDRFTYSLWVTNLTDETYSTYTTPNARGNSNTYPQRRQIGVGIAAKL
jgi:iron complex outermembrane recepter protein